MISILLPVRRDSLLLEDCIKSIIEMADDISHVEVVISLSHNEKRNLDFVRNPPMPLKIVYNDKSLGRVGLHDYMNSCVTASSGSLLWHLCDDFRVRTKGFDSILKEYEHLGSKVYRFIPNPQQKHKISGFVSPMITRKWVEVTGHWALSYSVDSWIGEIAYYLPKDRQEVNLPIDVEDKTYTDKAQGIVTPRTDEDEDLKKIEQLLKTRKWEMPVIREEIKHDAYLLNEAVKHE